MSTIRHNTTNRDGTGLVIREEADGNIVGYLIGVVHSTRVFKHVPHRGGREFTSRVGKALPQVIFTLPLGLASASIWKSGQEMANAVVRAYEAQRAKA